MRVITPTRSIHGVYSLTWEVFPFDGVAILLAQIMRVTPKQVDESGLLKFRTLTKADRDLLDANPTHQPVVFYGLPCWTWYDDDVDCLFYEPLGLVRHSAPRA